MAPTIYLRLRKNVRLPAGMSVHLGDIAQILAPSENEQILKNIVLDRPEVQDGNRMIMDLLYIIARIHEVIPDCNVEYIGEPQTLVEIAKDEKKPSKILFVLVWLLLFFGSVLTIMNFHEDVSMPKVQIRLVEMITGKRDEHPYLFQGAYSIGIGLGMVIFFNHIFKKKWNEEPTPLEVEMYLYQENMNQYVISEEFRKSVHEPIKEQSE
ncbi:stage V sporulation protein AA [Paenibacillus shirakamiensis]|uniref:Stage V sporulation protein AA n=1 Tax=Paenibacillus shirakamiensis TaxID=1265935 RepID=A0ABS4JEC5_9BACL|nr:stage V sporulation protein AA [Paenibacillus shirakamiensis]MBP1999486.1 stage V sporulation protein AA [Paenibacillus shirakamiensis]